MKKASGSSVPPSRSMTTTTKLTRGTGSIFTGSNPREPVQMNAGGLIDRRTENRQRRTEASRMWKRLERGYLSTRGKGAGASAGCDSVFLATRLLGTDHLKSNIVISTAIMLMYLQGSELIYSGCLKGLSMFSRHNKHSQNSSFQIQDPSLMSISSNNAPADCQFDTPRVLSHTTDVGQLTGL